MTRREKYLKTIRRELEGHIPFEIFLCPVKEEQFKQKTGRTDYQDYFGMSLKYVMANVKQKKDFSRYFKDTENLDIDSYWGIGYRKGTFEHFWRLVSPLEGNITLDDLKNYPYIDPVNDLDWESLNERVKNFKDNDFPVAAAMATTIFEVAWEIRGFEDFMSDLMSEPELACYHMDRITEIRCESARRYAKAGVDILHTGDDVGTQIDMMMDPDLWRKYLKPRLKKVIDAGKEVNQDLIIDYHSDGNVQKIIPDLIEIGVDSLNPVQPECMDPVEIKRLYGDRLTLKGTIGTQTTLPFGTPEEVDRICKEMIEKVGKGGGLILCPTHMIEPEVPWENIEAMLNAIKKYSTIA